MKLGQYQPIRGLDNFAVILYIIRNPSPQIHFTNPEEITAMTKQFCCMLIVLLLAGATIVRAQDSAKPPMKETGKMEMGKDADKMKMDKEETTGALMSFSCDDKCGFMMRSRDEKELMKGVKDHMKKHHADMKMSDKDLKGMMKKEDTGGMK